MPTTIEIRRGLYANLPTSGALGEPFFCTDSGQLFIWNGTLMVLIGTTGGSVSYFQFNQSTPSATWVIAHNLNLSPVDVVVMDSTNTEVMVEKHFDSVNQVTVKFSAPTSGVATCIG